MSKILIIGDLHLGGSQVLGKPGSTGGLNSRIIDQFRLLDWILNLTEEHNISTLVFTGDVYDEPKPSYTISNLFLLFLKKCETLEIEVHIILGNHDLKRTGTHYTSALDLIDLSNTYIHKHINTIIKDNIGITFLPFRDRKSLNKNSCKEAIEIIKDQLEYEIAEIPQNYDKILIGHMALEGSVYCGYEIDDFSNELMCPIDIFKKYDYVWHGHIHKPQIMNKTPHIAHIGSLDISNFGEADHTKILILFDTELQEKFIEIPVPSRKLRKIIIDASISSDTDQFIKQQLIKEHNIKSIKDAVVKLEIKIPPDAKKINRSYIENTISDLGAFYLCGIVETRNIIAVPLEKINDVDNTISPQAAIKLWANQWKFDNENDRNMYIIKANSIIDDFNLKDK